MQHSNLDGKSQHFILAVLSSTAVVTSFWLGTRRAAELMAFLYDLRNINHAKANVQ
jgi:hypothetical protein